MGTAPLCGDPQYNKAKKFRFEVALVYLQQDESIFKK
jgi:hypothetical protein